MSDDKDKQPPENGEERTVFMPSGTGATTPPTPPEAGPPPAESEPAPAEAVPADPAPAESSAPASTPPATSAGATAFTPREGARAIQVGDVLNHIFEVKRFLARGGMGEVFEGCNVNTDERVAIKVMLPAMAADEKVVAMFRKEARTLTKLHHESLVQYRVLAQEPQLGVLYIVTDFIDGTNLADVLGKIEPSPDELAGLLRKLASGLGAAHRLGAVHRDMSPDNVILAGGDVHQAKIIDFGIAKDLDASSATIVGDGFAGKLNYVAPEQLGDFGREVGPWTDVYSLALVILAVAQGKNVNMSGSLVDAIDKRRKGPDLASIPGNIKPVIEAMLRPDPKDRLRSMDDVLAMLGGGTMTSFPPPPPPAPATPGVTSASTPGGGGGTKALVVGGVIAAALVAGGGAWYLMRDVVPGDASNTIVSNGAVANPGDPVEAARAAINTALPSVSCTWLDIGSVERGEEGVSVAMRGVAGDSAAAQREITTALTNAGLSNARVDFGDVAPILPAGCAALDTYRQARAASDYRLSVAQPRFQMTMQAPGMPYEGEMASNAVVNFNFGNGGGDFAVLGIEPSGLISPLIRDRADFESWVARSADGRPITDEGNGRYRLNIDLDHEGWSGIILISGQGPFDEGVIAPPIGARGPSWQNQFQTAAAERNWRVEMVWFQSVGGSSNGAPAPAANGGGDEGAKPTG